MTKLQELLTNVSKMEATKPDKQLKSLYSKKDREEGEAERSKALDAVEVDSSDTENGENDSVGAAEADEKQSDKNFEFGPTTGQRPSNPKRELVKYLEKKSEVSSILMVVQNLLGE